MTPPAESGWSALQETTSVRGLLFLFWLYRALGRLPFTLLFGALTLLPAFVFVALILVTPYALLVMMLYYLIFGFSLASFILNSYANSTFARLLKSEDDDETEDEHEAHEE